MAKSCCENKGHELANLRKSQAYVLKIVMAINLTMFFVEFFFGLISKSSALMADSLDMLGDAIVYGFSLYVLHKSMHWKSSAALIKGVIITAFGIGVFFDTASKLFYDTVPMAERMGLIGAIAMAANIACLILLTRHKDDDINMRSTWTCSRNDIIANTGVLVAAAGVALTNSKWPDLIVGFTISVLFIRSAWPILTESIGALRSPQLEQK